MKASRRTALRRSTDALDVLRGRRPKVDYGLLIVMPFLAAAGGVLLSLALENAVERRRARPPALVPQPSGTDEVRAGARANH